MKPPRTLPWDWHDGVVPGNVHVHESAYLETSYSFQLFRSRRDPAIDIGAGSSVYLGVMFDTGPAARVRIGDYVLMNGARLICDSEISIGDYCLISWNVVLMDSYRMPRDARLRRIALENLSERPPVEGSPIRLGRNVWVGFDSCILPGVTIGEGSIIGARSVVAGDIPPYSVAAGNPARVIRQLPTHEGP